MKKKIIIPIAIILILGIIIGINNYINGAKVNTGIEPDSFTSTVSGEKNKVDNTSNIGIIKDTHEEYYLINDEIKVLLNFEMPVFNKEPINESEGRGDGFHWKDYMYDDIEIHALIGDDGIERCNRVITKSKNYKTPRGIKVGDSLQELQEKYPEDLEKALTDPWYNIYIYHPEDEIGFNRIFFSLENDIITEIKLENGIDG